MAQLPEDRSRNNTRDEHISDHHEIARLHNILDGSTVPSTGGGGGGGAVDSVDGLTGVVLLPGDGVAGTATKRSLGTGSTQAAPGDVVAGHTTSIATNTSSITAEAVLARNADNLSSGTVADARIAGTIARDSEVATAVSSHAGAADPHTGYQKESEKSQASGYASLDSATKVPTAELGGAGADNTKFLRGDQTWQTPGGASAPLTLTAPALTDVPLVLKGAASQSADLLRLVDSVGTPLTYFTSTGRIVFRQNGGLADYCFMEASGVTTIHFGGNIDASVGAVGAAYLSAAYNVVLAGGDVGSGLGAIGIGNAETVPTTNPGEGGVLYAEGGVLKYRSAGGTVTTIAPN